MNAGKSLKIALINRDRTQVWLAKELDVKHQIVNRWCNSTSMRLTTLEMVAKQLGYKASEFIALGEQG